MFQNLVLSSSKRPRRSRRSLFYSLAVHLLLLGGLLALPVLFYDELPHSDFVSYVMAAPVAVAPPEPPPVQAAHQTPESPGLTKPSIFLLDEPVPGMEPQIAPPTGDVIRIRARDLHRFHPGKVPGWDSGVPTGGGTVPLVIPSVGHGPPPPPPPPPVRREPLKVHGGIQASKLVHKVVPRYPELAKRARVEGSVLLNALIGEDGSITHLEVVRGHRLLRKAAFDAVNRWRYSPTLLSGKPVQVSTTITVVFHLR